MVKMPLNPLAPFPIRPKHTGLGDHKRSNNITESGLTGLIVCHVNTWASFRQGNKCHLNQKLKN